MKIGKTKSKDERTESDVPLKIFNISTPFLLSFFLASFSNIFVFVFPIDIKMRDVYVGGNKNKKELENVFFSYFLYLLQYVFFKEK